MEPREIQQYIVLGGKEKYLEDVDTGWKVHGDKYVLGNLESFLDQLKTLEFPVTAKAAWYSRLDELRDELRNTERDAGLTQEQAEQLHSEMPKIRLALFGESALKLAFIVREKRYGTEKLLEAPDELFAPGIFTSLGEGIQYDIEEACKCVAFERPTAAAFHLMRATEGTLRHFYCTTVKRERVDALLWYPMVEHLRRRSKPPPQSMLDQLDSIRKHFRNPTQHPEAIYDVQEAQDLLALALDAITRLTRALPSTTSR